MADKRIKDLAQTATSPAVDDYVVLDGATNKSRKMLATYVTLKSPDNSRWQLNISNAGDLSATKL
jgi:hypothetical protein